MTGMLDGIAADIAAALNGELYAGTLRKPGTITGRDDNGDPITSAPTDYAVQGFRATYDAITIATAGIPATDSKIVLIAGLCEAVPAMGDKINLQSQWFQIRKDISIDPAGATYACQSFVVPS